MLFREDGNVCCWLMLLSLCSEQQMVAQTLGVETIQARAQVEKSLSYSKVQNKAVCMY
jgi:hypothetical protein